MILPIGLNYPFPLCWKCGERHSVFGECEREPMTETPVRYAIAGYDHEEALFVIGPFESKEKAREYADEFGGGWVGWNIVPITKPEW